VWVVHSYQWLVANNLWKATVAFWVTLALGTALRPWRAWKQHRAAQDKIADSLDTSTPGGLTELAASLRKLADAVGKEPDDNGSDDPVRGHAARNTDVDLPAITKNVHGGSHGR
jgi:hypothetical protein